MQTHNAYEQAIIKHLEDLERVQFPRNMLPEGPVIFLVNRILAKGKVIVAVEFHSKAEGDLTREVLLLINDQGKWQVFESNGVGSPIAEEVGAIDVSIGSLNGHLVLYGRILDARASEIAVEFADGTVIREPIKGHAYILVGLGKTQFPPGDIKVFDANNLLIQRIRR